MADVAEDTDVADPEPVAPRLTRLLRALSSTPRRAWATWAVTRLLGSVVVLRASGVMAGLTEDVVLYGEWARLLQSGLLPYRDFFVEYPPAVLTVLLLPASSEELYRASFLALALAADAAVFAVLSRSRATWGRACWLWTPLLLGPVFWSRLDVFVALALVVAVVALRSRPSWSAAALVLSTGFKLWPVLLLPAFLAYIPRERRRGFLLAAGASALVLLGPVLAWGGWSGLVRMWRYHSGRGIEVEALVAVPLHIQRLVGEGVDVVIDHRCLEFPAMATGPLIPVAGGLLALALVGLVWLVVRRRPRPAPELVTLALAAAVITFGTVLSPQYVVWLAACVALVVDRLEDAHARAHLLAAGAALALTSQYLFPYALPALADGSAVGVMTAVAHGIAVVWMAAAVARILVRKGEGAV